MNSLAALLVFSPALAFSALTPSFDLEWQLKESQVVVLATEGDVIDGKLTVLSSYRGSLKPGDVINLPLLSRLSRSCPESGSSPAVEDVRSPET